MASIEEKVEEHFKALLDDLEYDISARRRRLTAPLPRHLKKLIPNLAARV